MSPLRHAPRFALACVVVGSLAFESQASDDAPAPKLAGTWTWTWKDKDGVTHRHVLEVEGVDKTLAAREVFDDQPPVRVEKLTLDGKALKFTVVRGEHKAEYSGKVADADHVNGTVLVTVKGDATENEWKAERRKDVPK